MNNELKRDKNNIEDEYRKMIFEMSDEMSDRIWDKIEAGVNSSDRSNRIESFEGYSKHKDVVCKKRRNINYYQFYALAGVAACFIIFMVATSFNIKKGYNMDSFGIESDEVHSVAAQESISYESNSSEAQESVSYEDSSSEAQEAMSRETDFSEMQEAEDEDAIAAMPVDVGESENNEGNIVEAQIKVVSLGDDLEYTICVLDAPKGTLDVGAVLTVKSDVPLQNDTVYTVTFASSKEVSNDGEFVYLVIDAKEE